MKCSRLIMKIWIQLTYSLLLLHESQSSSVVDSAVADGVYLEDYCPNMEFCPEGSHTMCVNYDPGNIHGPKCANFQNVSITPDMAQKLLDIVNEIRGQVAMGTETGYRNVSLPRGFGMFKLKWDNELATFAQVLANTCSVRLDLCRATKRFSDPGQLICVIRFTVPDWLPISNIEKLPEKGLGKSKIEYTVEESCKSWYFDKQHVTVDMLQRKPNWLLQPTRTKGKHFMQLIDGSTTHMGCGISAYMEYYNLGSNKGNVVYNLMHVVCNFSSAPKTGTAVYKMNNLNNVDFCGCPPGIEHDERCLCTDPINSTPEEISSDRDPTTEVVLLPIFTPEDLTSNKTLRISLSGTNDIGLNSDSVFRFYRKTDLYFGDMKEQSNLNENPLTWKPSNEKSLLKTFHYEHNRGVINNNIDNQDKGHNRSFSIRQWNAVGNVVPTQLISINRNMNSILHHNRRRKGSIFAKSRRFEIPGTHRSKNDVPIKQDVSPRRDFTNIQSVLDNYMIKKNKGSVPHETSLTSRTVVKPRFKKPSTLATKVQQTAARLNSTHIKLSENNKLILSRLKQRNSIYKDLNSKSSEHKKSKGHEYDSVNELNASYNIQNISEDNIQNINELSDKKLLTLLDTLEKEVKHIELDNNKKELIDQKIRKIYGTVVGKFSEISPRISLKINESKPNADYDPFVSHLSFNDGLDKTKKQNLEKEVAEDRNNEIHRKVQENYPNPDFINQINTKDSSGNPISEDSYKSRLNKRKKLYQDDNNPYEPRLNEIDMEDVVRSVPSSISGIQQYIKQPELRFRSELEIEQPRVHMSDIDFQKRQQMIPYKKINKPYQRHERELYNSRTDFKTDNDNSIDGRRSKNEQNIPRIDFREGEKPKTYYNWKKNYNEPFSKYDKESNEEALLPEERRIYYQEKLNNLQRKLQPEFRSNHDMTREQRLVRQQKMQNKNNLPQQIQPQSSSRHFYIPDRALSVHNF